MIRTESLPTGRFERGRIVPDSDPYDWTKYITCQPYGEMADGTMVWEDEDGNQYTRNIRFGKYFFVQI